MPRALGLMSLLIRNRRHEQSHHHDPQAPGLPAHTRVTRRAGRLFMPSFELAQVNVATLKAPIDSPMLADFVADLGRINELAEASPGFVWRLRTDEGDATALRPFGEDLLVNLSVWKDMAALRGFVFNRGHMQMMRRRREWFTRMAEACVVFWWVPRGRRPTLQDARGRLAHLRLSGPTERAFDLRNPFPAPTATIHCAIDAQRELRGAA